MFSLNDLEALLRKPVKGKEQFFCPPFLVKGGNLGEKGMCRVLCVHDVQVCTLDSSQGVTAEDWRGSSVAKVGAV